MPDTQPEPSPVEDVTEAQIRRFLSGWPLRWQEGEWQLLDPEGCLAGHGPTAIAALCRALRGMWDALP